MSIMYHECGYPLLMDGIKRGHQVLAEFFDAKIKDHAEKVTTCPHCGEPLGKLRQHPDAFRADIGLNPGY